MKNDKKDGKGIIYYNSGNRYEGNWKKNKRNGSGYYFNNGIKQIGDFSDGRKIRKHLLLKNNGVKLLFINK